MIAFFHTIQPLVMEKKIYTGGFLICLIHSRGNPFCDLLMKDVCISLAAAYHAAAPYPGSLHIHTACSKTLLREYLHCLCLQNRKR